MTTALLFSGQGAQEPGMGKTLHEAQPLVKAVYDEASDILGMDLAKVSFEGPEAELTQTAVCQPALFVHGFSVFSILRENKLLGDFHAALGLSLGEVTALTVAGVFDFATGLRVVAERGKLMQDACEATRGGMASVLGADREAVGELCREFDIDMANLNCPGQIVISGETDKVKAAVAAAKDRGFKRVVPLNVAGAYHSRLMEPARAAFAEYLETVEFAEPRVTVFSNTTGQPVRTPGEIREALIRQVVSPVLWEDCLRNAAALPVDRFIECGPRGILAGLARRTDPSWKVIPVSGQEDLAKLNG